MNTNTATKIIAAATITICLGTAGPVHATANRNGDQTAARTEPEPGQLIGQRKAGATLDFVAYAAARASYAAGARRTEGPNGGSDRNDPPRPCAKFPDLCGITAAL